MLSVFTTVVLLQDEDSTDLEVDYSLFEERIWPILAERVPAFEALKVTTIYTPANKIYTVLVITHYI